MQLRVTYRAEHGIDVGYDKTLPSPAWLRIEASPSGVGHEDVVEVPISTGVVLGVTRSQPRRFVFLSGPADAADLELLASVVESVLGPDVWTSVLSSITAGVDATGSVEHEPATRTDTAIAEIATAVEDGRLVALPMSEEEEQAGAALAILMLRRIAKSNPERAAQVLARIMEEEDEDGA